MYRRHKEGKELHVIEKICPRLKCKSWIYPAFLEEKARVSNTDSGTIHHLQAKASTSYGRPFVILIASI